MKIPDNKRIKDKYMIFNYTKRLKICPIIKYTYTGCGGDISLHFQARGFVSTCNKKKTDITLLFSKLKVTFLIDTAKPLNSVLNTSNNVHNFTKLFPYFSIYLYCGCMCVCVCVCVCGVCVCVRVVCVCVCVCVCRFCNVWVFW